MSRWARSTGAVGGALVMGLALGLATWGLSAPSPDGSKVFVGLDFTAVDGSARGHIAAFNTATGQSARRCRDVFYAMCRQLS